jgi:hypothetical protein
MAQGIGAVLSVTAAVLAVGFGQSTAAYLVLALVVVAATLESVFAFCLGCKLFALLIQAGVIPEQVCERCANLESRSGGYPPGRAARRAGLATDLD